jgi:hypothetical protein
VTISGGSVLSAGSHPEDRRRVTELRMQTIQSPTSNIIDLNDKLRERRLARLMQLLIKSLAKISAGRR